MLATVASGSCKGPCEGTIGDSLLPAEEPCVLMQVSVLTSHHEPWGNGQQDQAAPEAIGTTAEAATSAIGAGAARLTPCAGTGLRQVCKNLGPLERLVLAALSAPKTKGGRVTCLSQLFISTTQRTTGTTILLSACIGVAIIIVIGVVVVFVYNPQVAGEHYERPRKAESTEGSESVPEGVSGSSTKSAEKGWVDCRQSLPPVKNMDGFAARPWQEELVSSDRVLPSARMDTPDGPPQSAADGTGMLKPMSSSPAGQGVPGGRLAASKAPQARPAEMPPPLCSALVLPVCEAHFAVAVPALAAMDESGGGSLDVVGLSGNPLLRAAARQVPGGRLLEVAMAHPGSQPRATIGPRPQDAEGSGGLPQATQEIRGTGGSVYGLLEARSSTCYAVTRSGRELLAIRGASDSLELSVSVGERQVADVTCSGENFGGVPHLELKVQPGIDAVLVLSCVLAIVLQSTWST
eukprot:CAMPEP_0179196344 /NCGR_PEP_ID=MMETSP0796-20121207/97627_1 /TAXON_ID=73915 /ORGANISM="Pyrodinium bahamense, Strain pbaha01" /LENGTH=463 /DNA_ID=CAMNT_0020900743 /DNA_START=111 /DNA_END=1502 /DNA_ORIENTATION=+